MKLNRISPWLKNGLKFSKKVFIKILNEPFVKVTCTVIAGLLGWWLGVQYQDKNWKEQNSLSMLESDRKQAEVIFNEVSRLMDDRHYKTTRLLSAHRQNDSIKIRRYKDSLILNLEEWNANRHRTYSLIEAYFGPAFTTYYKINIQSPFADTGNRIIYEKKLTEEDKKYLKETLDSLETNISTFNSMMLRAIRQNKIGRFY